MTKILTPAGLPQSRSFAKSPQLKSLDKYGLAANLLDQIVATYDTEDPDVFRKNNQYLSDASEAPSGLKLMSAYLDKLFTLLVETESSDLARKW